MSGSVPDRPKIYHIVHVDKIASIIADECLWSDGEASRRGVIGTTIGMKAIKARRLTELKLQSHPNLFVGECVPFYFCPRSVMLYMFWRNNHAELTYHGGQQPIVHLEADLYETVAWADASKRRWAFTATNAGSRYFNDWCDPGQLDMLSWDVIGSNNWSGHQDSKQAEFLMEGSFPWELISRIGVYSQQYYTQVQQILQGSEHKPRAEILRQWYY